MIIISNKSKIREQIERLGTPVLSLTSEEFRNSFLPGQVIDSQQFMNQMSSKLEKISQSPTIHPEEIDLPKKIKVKNSQGRGLGVFATEFIGSGEIIETCALLPLSVPFGSNILSDYRFMYPKNSLTNYAIALGYGSFYNHSDLPNADWIEHPKWTAFNFVAKRDIMAEEEIFIYYGDEEYWNHRQHIKKI